MAAAAVTQPLVHTRARKGEALTPREQEVLVLVAEGCSTKEIASQLGISFKTASCHRSRIMAKLGAHEVTYLVRYAIKRGLIQP